MKKQQGFTLIEISIVLVIIGLLAGGVLKGQQMIENAKYKALVKHIDGVRSAVYGFKDRYRYLPGDMPYTNSLPQIVGASPIAGNGDGLIDMNTEGASAVQHLIQAGLIAGDPSNPSAQVSISSGGILSRIFHSTRNKFLLRVEYANVPVRYVKRLDEEFDDGAPDTGDIHIYPYVSTWAENEVTTLIVKL